MKRRTVIQTLGSAIPGTVFQSCAPSVTQTNRPNIVVIYTDDQNLSDTGCYGGEMATPHMDSLARDGMRFTQYYASAPVCTASRYNLLTGQYASRSQGLQEQYPATDHAFIRWNSDFVPGDFTIARVLKEQGYVTGMVGKWHNGLGSWVGNQIGDLHQIAADSDPDDPDVKIRVRENYDAICERVRTHAGFDYAESIYGTNFLWLPLPEALMYHNQDWITKGAIDFIEQNQERPFFLYMASTIPHAPSALASIEADPRATPAGLLDEPLDVQPSRDDVLRRAEAAGFLEDDHRKSRWAGFAWLDDGVGAVLQKLDELNLSDNTTVIFASDHASRGKMTCYDGKVPCMIRGQGIRPGSVCDALVSNVDIVPTIYELCGVTPPQVPIDGRSIVPLLSEQSNPWRDSLYLEITYTRGVVTHDWKYIAIRFPQSIQHQVTDENRREFSQEGTRVSEGSRDGVRVRFRADRDFPGYYDADQLYDLSNDLLEQHNLAQDPRYADKLKEMQQRLTDYSKTLPHPFGEFG